MLNKIVLMGRLVRDPELRRTGGGTAVAALTLAVDRDYKTALQELVQRTPGSAIAYRLVKETGPDHCRVFVMEVTIGGTAAGQGEGRTKKEAEQMAARAAIERLNK